ncbi:hypothetical protein EDD22DRAFT_979524 [Suillus occidentalis]|nr:hypothetical protein EDD22DRAFT_979524 [Suillus occidentalis]
MSYSGIKPQDNVLLWMTAPYNVWYRDPLELVHNMLANPKFNGEIEFSPYRDYTTDNKWYWKNLLSGDWAWNQADLIAQNQETHGSMFVPLVMGSDKTVISVATGHTKYHPLYLLIGNIFNSVVVLVGFLAIPKSKDPHLNQSLAKNFESVKTFMETPDVTRFLDGHFRRTIYGIGPYITDYPEQVMLSGVVQRWCPRCLADSKDLDGGQPCLHRHEEHTELLIEQLMYKQLWSEYGICYELGWPFTNDFPHADIHKLLSPDLLHQIIKGTFKDHLVDWVYIPAIKDHVPEDIMRTFNDLVQLQEVLDHFHEYQEIFKMSGVTTSFSLPRQHSMCHYILMIRLFGVPNGLCSSITESKHIKAVKEPWHCSNRFRALGQMLLTNQRLDKLAAAHVDLEACSMLCGHNDDEDSESDDDSMVDMALAGLPGRLQVCEPQNQSVEGDTGEVLDRPTVESHVELGLTPHETPIKPPPLPPLPLPQP